MPYKVIKTIQLGPFHLNTWGLLVGLGIVAGLLIASWAGRKRGVPTDKLYNLAIVGVVAGLVGSRFVWALQPAEIGETLAHPLRLISLWQGGLTLVGGLVFGLGAALIYAWRARLPLRQTCDVIGVGLGPAIAIGRIGCFLSGLHPGKPTSLPWGIQFMGAVRHPIPLYESVLGVALFAFALVLYRRRLPAGALALAAGMFYLVGRSLLDMLRATGVDGADPRILGGMTLTQTISIFVVPAMAAGLWWVAKRRRVATTVPA